MPETDSVHVDLSHIVSRSKLTSTRLMMGQFRHIAMRLAVPINIPVLGGTLRPRVQCRSVLVFAGAAAALAASIELTRSEPGIISVTQQGAGLLLGF